MSASCSIDPDSRRSDSCGRLFSRVSTCRDSCDSAITGTAKLAYKFNPDILGYASYDRGFKSGGFDMRGDAILYPATVDGYDPETVETVDVRFRTVGDMTCTCPVESAAADATDVVGETLQVTISERGATRMDDRTSDASMERRKKEGYF